MAVSKIQKEMEKLSTLMEVKLKTLYLLQQNL